MGAKAHADGHGYKSDSGRPIMRTYRAEAKRAENKNKIGVAAELFHNESSAKSVITSVILIALIVRSAGVGHYNTR